jgi:hypothetical protein
MRRGENNTGVDSSMWLMNTDTLNTEWSGKSERDRNKRKKVKSKGKVSDTFMWREEEHHLLESFKDSPARPSGKSRIKNMKTYEEIW